MRRALNLFGFGSDYVIRTLPDKKIFLDRYEWRQIIIINIDIA